MAPYGALSGITDMNSRLFTRSSRRRARAACRSAREASNLPRL